MAVKLTDRAPVASTKPEFVKPTPEPLSVSDLPAYRSDVRDVSCISTGQKSCWAISNHQGGVAAGHHGSAPWWRPDPVGVLSLNNAGVDVELAGEGGVGRLVGGERRCGSCGT